MAQIQQQLKVARISLSSEQLGAASGLLRGVECPGEVLTSKLKLYRGWWPPAAPPPNHLWQKMNLTGISLPWRHPALATWSSTGLLLLNVQGVSGPGRSCPAKELPWGRVVLPPSGLCPTSPRQSRQCWAQAHHVSLRKSASPFPTLMSPTPPASIHPRAAGEPEDKGLSVLHTNTLATSIAHFHDRVTGCRERFTEGTVPGKSLEKVYVEKLPF